MSLIKIGNFLKKPENNIILIEDNTKYKIAGNQNYGQGLKLKSVVYGKDLKMKKYQVLKPNQLMWCKVDTKNGAFGITNDETTGSLASSNMAVFDIDVNRLNPNFLQLLFKIPYFYNYINNLSLGSTNRKYIKMNQFLDIVEIPNLTINQQNLFLEKYNSMNEKKIRLSEEFLLQKETISKLKTQLLQDAIMGKLTTQNPNDKVIDLLNSIKKEKEKLIKEKKIKKIKTFPLIPFDEIPFEIPKNWEWIRWNDLLSLYDGSMRRGPFGSSLKKDMFVPKADNTFKVYEQGNAIYDDPNRGDYYITETKYNELKSFEVKENDLIISCSGATLGRIGKIPDNFEKGVINQALLKININNNLMIKEYFIKLFRSEYLQNKLLVKAKGSAIPNMVGVDIIKSLEIPLPPLEEQKRIVEKIDSLFEKLEIIEKECEKNIEYSNQLLQSVLKEAFEN